MNNPISSTFSKWRIYIALFFGLSISGFLLVSNLSKTEFISVKIGTGDYTWRDSNHNNRVDLGNIAEFNPSQSGNYKKATAVEILLNINWSGSVFGWLFLAVLGMVGRDLGYMWRIRILTKRELSWRQSFRVIMLWEFASAVAPGVVSGAAVAVFILNKEKIAFGRAGAIALVTAFLDNLFYVLLVPIVLFFVSASVLFPKDTGLENASVVFWFGYAIFSCLCLLLYLSIFRYPKLISGLLAQLVKLPFLKRWQPKAHQIGNDIEQTAIVMQSESRYYWFSAFLATICSWVSRYLVINCILQAFLHLGIVQQLFVFAKQMVLWMLLRVSPTPGGSGVAEWAFGELLADISSSSVLLVVMAVLWRLMSYFPYLFIGSFVLAKWLKKE